MSECVCVPLIELLLNIPPLMNLYYIEHYRFVATVADVHIGHRI